MSDDKIVPIGTGYTPEAPPPTAADVAGLHLHFAILLDEMEVLSKRVTQLTAAVRELSRR